jgi:hypothetical protein
MRNDPASQAGPTATMRARSGNGPPACTPATMNAIPTATSAAVSHGLACGARLSARTASATKAPTATTPPATSATGRGELSPLLCSRQDRRSSDA